VTSPNDRPYRRYDLFVLVLVLAFLGALVPRVLAWEPFVGSQTRVSGLPEREYGWNRPQEFFAQRAFRIVRRPKEYDHHYDIVVVGDSFSGFEFQNGWLDYLTDLTGASVLCLWTDRPADFEAVLSSEWFRKQPPRLLVYESVERQLIQRLSALAGEAELPPATAHPPAPPLPLRPRHAAKEPRERPRSGPLLQTIREVAASTQAGLGLRLQVDTTAVVALGTKELFSSRRSDEILLLGLDRPKLRLTAADVKRAARGLRRVERLAQANGHTRFALVAFPDKSSLYSRYFLDRKHATPNFIEALASEAPDVRFLRLDRLFAELLEQKAADLYLPDDSHTSALGSRTAAEALLAALLAEGTVSER
jgi:hypothetical protein